LLQTIFLGVLLLLRVLSIPEALLRAGCVLGGSLLIVFRLFKICGGLESRCDIDEWLKANFDVSPSCPIAELLF
jgi:hypothetical protein